MIAYAPAVGQLSYFLTLSKFAFFQCNIENFLDGSLGNLICVCIEDNIGNYIEEFMYWYGKNVTDAIAAKVLKKNLCFLFLLIIIISSFSKQ